MRRAVITGLGFITSIGNDRAEVTQALEEIWERVRRLNRYVEERAPWKLGKSADPADQARLRTSLATIAEALRLGSTLLQAVMPSTTEKIQAALGYKPGAVWRDELVWGGRLTGSEVQASLVLFPRPQPAAKPEAEKK